LTPKHLPAARLVAQRWNNLVIERFIGPFELTFFNPDFRKKMEELVRMAPSSKFIQAILGSLLLD